eukprot:TRINITY_DN23699_c0_g1_i1.p1 TRINITY_DN23699_c0_g1~~TRINITY_DN23699_c0_g1_i1.p1  ORF type:complete len:319 (+),score=83.51 TRINITY_DN23699_c0_g1_i1:273-1229(+)
MVMEECNEGSVKMYVTQHGAFSEEAASGLLFMMLEGIDYLHRKRIGHRDIKPANLLLHRPRKQQLVLKVADLNSARQVGAQGPMLSVCGTPLFCAPEARFGLDWNERVDIWACGMSSAFMLQGRLPFRHSAATEAHLRAGHLPTLSLLGLSSTACSYLLQCLTVDMNDRPTAMELMMHPMFSEAEATTDDDSEVSSCHSTSESEVVTEIRFFDSCGLIFQKQHAGAAELHGGRGMIAQADRYASAPALDGNASCPEQTRGRGCSAALRRLMRRRCERMRRAVAKQYKLTASLGCNEEALLGGQLHRDCYSPTAAALVA